MGRVFNLDDLRDQTTGERPSIVWFGKEFELPAAMPFATVVAFASNSDVDAVNAVIALIGEAGLRHALDQGASTDDIVALLLTVQNTVYGAPAPEVSSAPSQSSSDTPGRLKLTSDGSTDSTSESAASDEPPSTAAASSG